MTRGRSLRDNHDEATIAQAEDGRWSFACRCGFAQNCGSFDAAQFLALNHGVGRVVKPSGTLIYRRDLSTIGSP